MNTTSGATESELPLRGLPTEAIGSVVAFLFIVGVGVFFAYDGVHGTMMGLGTSFLVKGLAKALLAWGGAAYFFFSYRDVPGIFRARDRVRDRPGDVVWVFEKVVHRRGDITRSLVLGFADGQLLSWSLPAPLTEQPTVRSWIERRLPHATIGHTPELARRFAAAPRELLRPSA